MSVSDLIEPVGVEEGIHAMVYLQEGNLLLYMEGIVKHDKIILMQFFKTRKDRKVIVNGMGFDIFEETIARAEKFSMEGKKWQTQSKVNEKVSVQFFFKLKEEPTSMHGVFSWDDLPKTWDAICYTIMQYITLEHYFQVIYCYHFPILNHFINLDHISFLFLLLHLLEGSI